MQKLTIVIKTESSTYLKLPELQEVLDELEQGLKEDVGMEFVDISWTED